MKILAISGTPHRNIGSSSILLKHVFEGVKNVAPDTICENIFIVKKKIGYCKGCASCLTNDECAQKDDMNEIVQKMLLADGIILTSPTYIGSVTAQMKTFIDRLLPYAHRPRLDGKYGLSVSVSAGWGDEVVGEYMAGFLTGLGVTNIGVLRAIATGPNIFLDKEIAIEHANRMGQQLARAINEKWRIPKSSSLNVFNLFLVDMIKKHSALFNEDYKYWQAKGYIKN